MAVVQLTLFFVLVASVSADVIPKKSEPSGFILLGTTRQLQGNSQISFHLSADKNSWEDAFNKCRDELDGKLLTLESAAKEKQIKDYLTAYTLDYIWTDGLYDADSKVWYWLSTEQPISYSNWKAGVTPNNGSAFRIAFYKALKPNWQSLPNSNLNRYICEVAQ